MILDAIKQAQSMHRAVVEARYDGTCQVFSMQPVKNPDTKVTRQAEVLMLKDLPCHLSFSAAPPTAGSGTITTAVQTIKLFLAPEAVIEPGSRIEVVQMGRTESFHQSGKAAVYSSHQEISLELWKGYA